MSSTMKHVAATALVLLVGAAAAGAAFVWSGVYDVGADARHSALVYDTLETLRERSIKTRAEKLQAPADLNGETRVLSGAGNYDAMCVQCHLAPGMQPTELSKGLYPEPPNLTKVKVDPAHAFWIIKHGIKASGMPAWGPSMQDEYVWNMAAFLQKLPELDAAGYQRLVAASGGHAHGGGESGGHGHGGQPENISKVGTDARGAAGATGAGDGHAHEAGGAHAHTAASSAKPAAAAARPKKPPAPAAHSHHHDDGHKH